MLYVSSIIGFILTLTLSFLLTGTVRKYALRKKILDIPNARSSHSVATPRGGGLAIAVLFLLGVGIFAVSGIVSTNVATALCGGGLLVALIGWIDDCRKLSVSVRAVFHFAAAIWAVYWLGGLSNLYVGFTTISIGLIDSILAVVGIVWFINLYNFMDGIDGIAGSEALSVGLIGGTLTLAAGQPGLATAAWLLAAASAGFLLWNWPPAKIFMGDVGSGLLGYSFAVIAVGSEKLGGIPLLIWLLLLGVFIVDATATLLRRIWHGERWYEPHRTHVYQLAVQAGFSHKQVTLTVLGLNILLAALALISIFWPGTLLWVFFAGNLLLLGLHVFLLRFFGCRQTLTTVEGKRQISYMDNNISFLILFEQVDKHE
ncbi:MraY family glycosyltransferase [Moorella sulfitireducens]|uniref:MraY family glycosyltransferase n=1 Tax=Neomoorella sulfitireducens TaxID=2972948 RepID=UPI0021AC6C7D|nr:glycosyltransferase family 4 protein [Moorella sulfitireducens]